MSYAHIAVSAAALRRKPDHREEMVNQLLFGETVRITRKNKDGWVKVRSLHDGYEGWTTMALLAATQTPCTNTSSQFLVAETAGVITMHDIRFPVTKGASLPAFVMESAAPDNGNGVIGSVHFQFKGKTADTLSGLASCEMICNEALKWQHTPYLWGGRTPFGIDCSGLVQVVYKMAGIYLQRDAWQQERQGKSVKKFKLVKPGDLAFFSSGNRITHVGIMLDNDTIIHASGKVRIEGISKKGFIENSPGRKIKLSSIRRIIV